MIVKQSENTVKTAIRQYLELHGYKVYRINNGGVFRGKNKDGGTRFSFAGDKGVADLYAIKDGDYPIWIEVKATGKKSSASQKEFADRVNKTFGTYWIEADSLDVFIKTMKSFNDMNLQAIEPYNG